MSMWVNVKDRLPTYAELNDEQVLALFDDSTIASVSFDEDNANPEDYFGYWHNRYHPDTLGLIGSEWSPMHGIMYWAPMPEMPEDWE